MAQPKKAETTSTAGTPPTGPDLNMVFAPLRPDLIFQRQRFKNEEYYVVKDPLSLAYFRLRPEETFLLHLLNGQRTLREIVEIYSEEFPNSPRSPQDVAQFCNQVGRSGLLVINARSFIDIIKNKPKPKYSLFMLWVKAVSKLMFFKLPLLDPSPWLGKLVNQVRFLWSTPVVVSCLVFYAFTGLWVFLHRQAFETNTINFFSPSNLILLPFITIFIKTCHEFGHATTCARFGGEVHEMGVCCICFMPCGYVDASDAWMMRRKSHKIYVTIAGVFTEFMIASICVYLWFNLKDGLVRNLTFNAMVVASVNTLIFNMNPLMKFDGYYVISDMLEIPNLRTKSMLYCSYQMQRFLLGYRNTMQERMLDHEDPGKIFVIYAVSAYLYMATVIYGLSQLFARFLEKYELRDFGLLLGIAAQASFLAFPVIRMFYDAFKPGAHIEPIEPLKKRVAKWASVLVILIGVLFVFPVHFKVETQGILIAKAGEVITSPLPGFLTELDVHTGEWVTAGKLLGRLQNRDVDESLMSADVQFDLAKLQLAQEKSKPEDKAQLGEALAFMGSAFLERQQAYESLNELALVSHIDGYVVTPDAERLLGQYFPSDRSVLRVADTRSLELMVPVTEELVGLIEVGSPVHGRVVATGESTNGAVTTIFDQKAGGDTYAWALIEQFGGPFEARYQPYVRDNYVPIYMVEVALDGLNPKEVQEMMRVHVTIIGKRTTVAAKLWRKFLNWWNFKGVGRNPFSQT